MDRRQFIECGLAALATGIVSLAAGCKRAEAPQGQQLGNQDKLWDIASGTDKRDAPLELSYAKDTPAFFRDESLGKVDPNFKPATGGG
ncbi:MAG: hypothetical protein QME27_07575 [Syntrophaceae bacterium]|nr:hypothetical protein [Syntrophaceae bacterium]